MSHAHGSDKELEIKIQTTKGIWDPSFSKTTKVQEVTQAVISHFGFTADGKYQLHLENDADSPLDPQRPLVSYGIKDGDVLIFTDLGVAV